MSYWKTWTLLSPLVLAALIVGAPAFAQENGELRDKLRHQFQCEVYFPVAVAQWNAIRCEKIKLAADGNDLGIMELRRQG